jgi:exosortase A-associated hydrolase 1
MNLLHEKALVFDCGADRLLGILHVPSSNPRTLGVLVVVGGPQYRAGSHRQFVLMARALAAAGYPVLRFDHRGIGDSDGAPRSFEHLEEDVRAALDALHAEVPALRSCVIYGLCDAASAALMYCRSDPRLAGLILANPWVHSEAGAAKAYVRHYYGDRLLQGSFWRKVASGEFDLVGSVRDLLRKLRASSRFANGNAARAGFRGRMLEGLSKFGGKVLLLVSGRDLTASEFLDLCETDTRWRAALRRSNVETCRYEGADHTFSAADGLALATEDCASWLDRLSSR